MVKKMHGQFFFQLSTLKCLFLKFRFLIMILLLCFCLDDSISMGLVSSSSVSSGLRAWRQSRAQGSGKNQAFQKWLAPRNHYTSIQMGGAWRAVLGKVHLRECWRKAGLWNAYSDMPDDDEPVPGGHRWRQRCHQWSRQFLHQASSVGSEESRWFLHLPTGWWRNSGSTVVYHGTSQCSSNHECTKQDSLCSVPVFPVLGFGSRA